MDHVARDQRVLPGPTDQHGVMVDRVAGGRNELDRLVERKIALNNLRALAGVERLATGCRFNEGAVYFGDARCLLWSDIPNNRIMRWDEETGRITIFRQPSNHANGNTRDRQGRPITCEHSGRRITRTEYDGTTAVLIDNKTDSEISHG